MNDLLVATATLLVRNEEVIAVAASGSSVVAVQEAGGATVIGRDSAGEASTGGEGSSECEERRDSAGGPESNTGGEGQRGGSEREAQHDPESEEDNFENEDDSSPTDDQEPDYTHVNISRISAIVNPQITDKDRYGYQFPANAQCTIIRGGQSHLPTEILTIGKLFDHFVKEIK